MAAQPLRDDAYDVGDAVDTSTPPAGLRVPPTHRRAPVHDHTLAGLGRAPAMWLLGAHGGAGVSTLAHVWAPAEDSQRGWPALDRHRSVVVVARTHRTGLAAAHDLLLQARAGLIGRCTVIGLALLPDAPGTLPKTLRRNADIVASAAPAVWHLPWVRDLRVFTLDELAVWSPAEPHAVAPSRVRMASSAISPHPGLIAAGSSVFGAAHLATSPH